MVVDTPMNKACVSSHRSQAEFVLAFDTDTTFQLGGFTPAQPVNVYPLHTSQLTLKCQFQDMKNIIEAILNQYNFSSLVSTH